MKPPKSPLLQKLSFFSKSVPLNNHSEYSLKDRRTEEVYRKRWQHDKVVRTTHGVNCTGSCSWKVHVKDGIITWETQQTDYPSTGPDMPEYEPRGCPRGATFSWYTYSPLRVRYPYVRKALLRLWREARKQTEDPVEAWDSIVNDAAKTKEYKAARGKGGFVRADRKEAMELIAAQLIHTIKNDGPDRIFGFSPIPAMSMVSHAAGARFLSLIGAPLLSFYDWYADLPASSPQIWGDQTDVPESSDWFNAGYLLIWGSNLPQTRTPDSHFMVEARYRGTKVSAVSPDYAEYVKFADDWLAVRPGMDGALAQAMTHVILKEFYVDQQVPYFIEYAKKFTDLPYFMMLEPAEANGFVTGKFLRASDLGMPLSNAEWKPVVFDENNQHFVVPNGSIGHRWEETGRWNLLDHDESQQLEGIEPVLSLLNREDEQVTLHLPYFSADREKIIRRNIPVKKIIVNGQEKYAATVFDVMMTNSGVNRGLPGEYPASYDDDIPYTPGWQEKITGVKKAQVIKVAREFAQNAADSNGRSMIIMGSGINHWYHSDTIYRSVLNMVLLTGCQGVNGGGWAHYVGQEKVRPLEGWQTVALSRDWGGPPRLQNGTSFFYFATEQWRHEEFSAEEMTSPVRNKPRYRHHADYNALAARLGWLPSYPQFDRNATKLYEESGAASKEEAINYIVDQLKSGNLSFAVENPGKKENFPKTLFVWRANLLGSSAKGHEYFLHHLLGTHGHTFSEYDDSLRTEAIHWEETTPSGKLDLLVNIDFRMNGTGLYSDIVLPAATWYEKHDISSTDMHPFIHPFNPAITPPWESKTDWDTFTELAEVFSTLAEKQFPEPVKDIVTTPLLHDSKEELAQPMGRVPDWKDGVTPPQPGVNLPQIHIVERDYQKIYKKMVSLGPTVKKTIGSKGLAWDAQEEYEKLQRLLGAVKWQEEAFAGCPSLEKGRSVAQAILTLSSTTNGSLAMKAWKVLEKKTKLSLQDLAEERAEEHLSFEEITAQPRKVITSPVYSGSETGNRRYSPFTTNVERKIPWRTLTGRQHFYLDHDIMLEFGEELPTFKSPLPSQVFYERDRQPEVDTKVITLNYLTPHYKWSYHSTYGDTLPMLTLFRGGPHVWLSPHDADEAEIEDNDWIEMYNRNGLVVARAVVSHRMPRGVVYMYHVQERHINVPGSPTTKDRGGTFNSPTKIHVKPTQMIGGYAQLSYGFNYYGPTGNQRDGYVHIRKLKEVKWLED